MPGTVAMVLLSIMQSKIRITKPRTILIPTVVENKLIINTTPFSIIFATMGPWIAVSGRRAWQKEQVM